MNDFKQKNQHIEQPGKGVMYYEPMDRRKSRKHPDFKGFIILEMDYKAGEKLKIAAWQKETSIKLPLLSLEEDNWSKKKELEHAQGLVTEDREVDIQYKAHASPASRKPKDWDSDVPF